MKKAILILSVIAAFIYADALYAQSKEDVLYLNNGSILRGQITGNIKGVQTAIEMLGRNTIVVPDSAIKMMLMDQNIPAKDRESKASPFEMAANAGFYGGPNNSGGFTFIPSYLFPFRLSTGFGMGIEWFEHQQIPVFVDTKYYLIKGAWSPYMYLQGGYAIPLSKKVDGDWSDYYGGVLAGVGGGLRFNFSKRNAFIFSLGYRYQKTKTVSNSYPWMSSYPQYETTRFDEYNRLTFSFGFLFN